MSRGVERKKNGDESGVLKCPFYGLIVIVEEALLDTCDNRCMFSEDGYCVYFGGTNGDGPNWEHCQYNTVERGDLIRNMQRKWVVATGKIRILSCGTPFSDWERYIMRK